MKTPKRILKGERNPRFRRPTCSSRPVAGPIPECVEPGPAYHVMPRPSGAGRLAALALAAGWLGFTPGDPFPEVDLLREETATAGAG